jgi:hypothetical protein
MMLLSVYLITQAASSHRAEPGALRWRHSDAHCELLQAGCCLPPRPYRTVTLDEPQQRQSLDPSLRLTLQAVRHPSANLKRILAGLRKNGFALVHGGDRHPLPT